MASSLEEKCAQLKSPKKVELNYSGANSYNENTFDEDNYEKDTKTTSRLVSISSYVKNNLMSSNLCFIYKQVILIVAFFSEMFLLIFVFVYLNS